MSGAQTCRRGRLGVRGGRGLCFVGLGVVFVGGAWGASDVVVCVSKIVEKPVPALRRPPNPRETQGGGCRDPPGKKKLRSVSLPISGLEPESCARNFMRTRS